MNADHNNVVGNDGLQGAVPSEAALQVAARRLEMSREAARAHAVAAPGLAGAWFFSTPGRGGGRLLVNEHGEALWAASGINPCAHVEAFRAGRRS